MVKSLFARAHAPGRGRRSAPRPIVRCALLGLLVAGAAVACTVPSPPPYPYWGPYGSAQGVTNEAQRRSTALEQYVKDFLDGKVPAQIPDSLVPEGRIDGVKNFYIQRPNEVDPNTQWGTRPAHPINTAAAQGSFPDPHATYLLLPQFLVPFGSKVTITGQFPRARYFSVQPTPSFKAENYRYQYAGEGEVAYVDADITPDPGSTNPFKPGANRNATNRNYTLTCNVAIGDPTVLDAQAWTAPNFRQAGNTRHCSGLVYRGPWGDPNFKDVNGNNNGDKLGLFDVGQIWVRIYAPDKSQNAFGGAPLPKVLYTLPDGRQYFINADISSFVTRANMTRALTNEAGSPPPNAWTGGTGWSKQFDIFRQVTAGAVQYYNYPYTGNVAQQKDYVSKLSLGVDGRGPNAPSVQRLEPHATGGVHINYLTKGTCLPNGSVYTIQGTMPTTPKTRNGEPTMTTAQARYWSVTGYSMKYDLNDKNYVTGAEVTSVMDDEIVTNASGGYVLMYGRAADRPANATAANGVTWVEWGPEACQSFTLRWLSIGPEWSFAKAPTQANLGWETDWAVPNYDPTKVGTDYRRGFLGNYQPITTTLTKAQFAAIGTNVQPLDSDLALKQTASASTTCCDHPASAVVDGDDTTAWESNWWAGPAWVSVDVGSVRTIDRVHVNWGAGNAATAFKVQVSQNNTTWTDVSGVLAGNDGAQSIAITPTSARYVRLTMTAGAGASYKVNALEVWGR